MDLKVTRTALLSLLVAGCGGPVQTVREACVIRLDQVGYQPEEAKMAFVTVPAATFKVVSDAGAVVLTGEVGEPLYWPDAGDTLRRIDFTELQRCGRYTLLLDDSLRSYPFEVADRAYADLARTVLRAFYYNRCSAAIDSAHGGRWARAAGHPDTCVLVHASAATKDRPEGTRLAAPGGWYDAGDYGKYIVNSGITTYTMLLAQRLFGADEAVQNVNIPESGNGLSDLLNETLVNLRWMLTMQDPVDGGVYHKLTTKQFVGFVMPDACHEQRYMIGRSTTAALCHAACLAAASRWLPAFSADLKPLADSCLAQAKLAFAWAEANPQAIFTNPEGIGTGAYGIEDEGMDDEWFWARMELSLATGDKRYAVPSAVVRDYAEPEWTTPGACGYFSAIVEGRDVEGVDAKGWARRAADKLLRQQLASPASLGMTQYKWGSNSFVANEGVLKYMAYKATGDRSYRHALLDDLHYLLGRNGTGYCYVSGMGTCSPLHIHHRPAEADGIGEPIPGFLVGGPNTLSLGDCGDQVKRSEFPAKSYVDAMCSYSTNEVAINWNAPMLFLALAAMN